MHELPNGGERPSNVRNGPAKSVWSGRCNLRNSLLVKHVVFLTLAVALASGILGHLAYLLARDILLDDVHERLKLIAAARTRLLQTSTGEHLRDVSLVASRTRMGQITADWADQTIEEAVFRLEIEKILSDAKKSKGGFREIWLADLQGVVIAASEESLLGREFGDRLVFKRGLSEPSLGVPMLRGDRYMSDVAAPVRTEDGPIFAVLMGELDVTPLTDALFDHTGLGETGEVLVGRCVEGKLNYLLPPNDRRGRDAALAENLPLLDACQGKIDAQIANYGDAAVLVAYRPVVYGSQSEQQWGLLAKIDLAEAYAPMMQLRRILLILQGGFAIAGAVASYWLARRLTRPIVDLTVTTAAIASGNLDTRVPIASNDELGLLGASFNHMAEQLAESWRLLEQRVDRRTTELTESQQELRRQTRILESILANMADGVIVADQEGRFLLWNPAAERIVGLGPQEVLPRDWSSVYGCYEADGKTPCAGQDLPLSRAMRGESVDGVELCLRNANLPEDAWINVNARPLKNEAGDLQGGVIVFRDVTESRRAQQALQRAKELAESASRAKSEFLANMSHEIRTPMNAVIGMTELVLETSLTPSQRNYLSMVLESGEALLSVINDILDFSKIEAGRCDLEQAVFDVREVAGDTLKTLAVRAHHKGLELACHVGPDIPQFVVGDKDRLRQIIVNLAGNAIKFTDHGEVVLDVACDSRCDGQAFLHFAVRDTGVGISEDKQRLIFEPFEQADESTTRRFGGTGLGLAISSRLVQLMGGRIWVRSTVGQGSTFHFTAKFSLPDAEHPLPPVPSTRSLRGVRALVVDDNETNRLILGEMLRNWMMQPTILGNPGEAIPVMLKHLRNQQPFEIVLIDANMPGVNGLELLEQIKQHPDLQSVPAIVLTSGGRDESALRREQHGIVACLTKPVKQSELFDAICRALGGAAQAERVPPTAEDAGPVAELPPLRILLVEDSPVNQKLALALLQPHGHTVTVANNGAEAVREYSSGSFDLVLMDVQMPEMDGLTATRVIREQERQSGRRTPILAMTAHAIKGDRELCLQAGMDAYVSKPVRARDLFAAIKRLVGERPASCIAQPVAEKQAQAPDNATTASLPSLAADAEKPFGDASAERTADVLDWDALRTRFALEEDSLRELAALFLQECPKQLAEIHGALADADSTRLRLAAHTFKGSAAIFDAKKAAALAQQLEAFALAGDFTEAGTTIEELETESRRLSYTLADHLRQP